jgi:prepilin-type N-terminal cleavage/methylation domain-containing protein
MNMQQKGFTLIELLIVVAIVAILAVVVVLTLNPAQLLKQSRDSTRISDLSTLKGAISLYLADGQTTLPSTSNCYAHASSSVSSSSCTAGSNPARFAVAGTWATISLTNATGTGWLPINFTLISSGSPLSAEPIDPVNNNTNFYAYRTGANSTFELNADMESTKYSNGQSNDVESTDGGDNPNLYEVGTAPGLNL